MANRNTQGFGLIPAGTLGATPSTGGQNKYKIDSGYGSSIYLGQPVQFDSCTGANAEQDISSAQELLQSNDWFLMVASTQMQLQKPTLRIFTRCYKYQRANKEISTAFVIDNPFHILFVQLVQIGALAMLHKLIWEEQWV